MVAIAPLVTMFFLRLAEDCTRDGGHMLSEVDIVSHDAASQGCSMLYSESI
jgi:hypothetical protein